MRVAVGTTFFLMSRTGRDVDLLADDGVDPGGFGLNEELDGPVQHTVIGKGDRRHPGLLGEANHVRDPAGPVEQAVFGMSVEVNEAHALRSSLTTASMW